ncbi:MAG TPA: hypothetical protein HA290_01825 [Candidatus Nitrosotenuis sp.]|jgi:hypothetical protein|nr:hypothetical protein [Candidatus Nitrosotenuis sp.]HII04211.1 hypothetical protein [Candidatus Nitrosotenuis sp.]
MLVKSVIVIISLALVLSMTSSVFADTTLTPIDSTKGIEKTITSFTVTKNNKLPWGFVEGKVTNPVEGNPVIIQIFKNGEPVHFAQTDVKKDGSFQYKFRVRDVTDGKITKIFDGDYIVKIFKVVYLPVSTTSA